MLSKLALLSLAASVAGLPWGGVRPARLAMLAA